MGLDERLKDAQPELAPRTAVLARHLDDLVLLSEAAALPRRGIGRRGIAIGTLATVGVLGVGGAAAAVGLLPTRIPWITDAGTSCSLYVSVEPRFGGDERAEDPALARSEDATLAAARDYLAALDAESIDGQEAAADWFTTLERDAAAPVSRGELRAQFRGDRLEVHALMNEVDERLKDYLAARGFDSSRITATTASRCSQ